MRDVFRILVVTAAILAAFLGASCQQASNNTVANNASAANISVNTTPAQSAPAAPATSDAEAGTPTAAYVAAYNARKNKDIPKLRSLMAKDILEFFEIIGEEDKKSIDDMLKDLADRPQADKPETRNEKINGDKATLEYLDEDGQWQTMDFVKEDGVWKLTLAVADNAGPEQDKSK